jgi:hypothetical protein
MSTSNGSLVITIKSKAKYTFHVASILLFYNLQKITLTKVTHFSKIYYHTEFQDPKLSGANVAPTLKIHVAIMLVLQWQESEKCDGGLACSGMMFISSFMKISIFI